VLKGNARAKDGGDALDAHHLVREVVLSKAHLAVRALPHLALHNLKALVLRAAREERRGGKWGVRGGETVEGRQCLQQQLAAALPAGQAQAQLPRTSISQCCMPWLTQVTGQVMA
jgi:hypothetical protein